MSSPYALPGGKNKKPGLHPGLIFLLAVGVAIVAGVFSGRVLGPMLKGLTTGGFPVGAPAADFRATTLDGKELHLLDLRGKVVVLDFWATWCGPCMRELPGVVAAHTRFAGRDDVVMIGISLDTDQADLEKTIADRGIRWPQVFDREMTPPVADLYGVNAIPFAMVIGRGGQVFARDVAADDLAAVIDSALVATL